METHGQATLTTPSDQSTRSAEAQRIRDALTGAAVIALAVTFVSVISYSGEDPIGFSLIDPFAILVLWLYLHSLRFTAPLLLTGTATVMTMASMSSLQPHEVSLDAAAMLMLAISVAIACVPVALLLAFVSGRGVRDTSGPFPQWIAATWLAVPILFVGAVLALNWLNHHITGSCVTGSMNGEAMEWSCSDGTRGYGDMPPR